jgi:hypothetical protein
MVKEDYGIMIKPITVQNGRADAIVKRFCQIVHTFLESDNNYLAEPNPWEGMLQCDVIQQCYRFHVLSQHQAIKNTHPAGLCGGRMILKNFKHTASWEFIRARKPQILY